MPLSAPDDVQVMVHNTTLAKVHWEPVSTASVQGELQGYKVKMLLLYLRLSVCNGSGFSFLCVPFKVYYRREGGLQEAGERDQQERVLTFSGNRSEGMLPGLHPYSLYSVFIRVLNSKGEGPPSSSKTFETPEGGSCLIIFRGIKSKL